jgi:hypothetical protein
LASLELRRTKASMTADDQLARIEADAAALREGIERIKASPQLCARFLAACARLRALEKEVRQATLSFLEAGRPVDGVELNQGRLSSVVTQEPILELCRDPDIKRQLSKLETFVQVACPVRESVYFSFCRRLGIKPRSKDVQRTRGLPFVVFKGALGGLRRAGRSVNEGDRF